MSREYSDLQVVPDQPSLEAAQPEKELATQQGAEKPAGDIPAYQDLSSSNRRICGLGRKTFWIVLAVATVVVIGAAVGGGVGGALSNRSSGSASASASASSDVSSSLSTGSQTTTPTTTVLSSVSITTTTQVDPTQTLLRDCPSSNNSLYEVSFGSDQFKFRKMCSVKLAQSGGNLVNVKTSSFDDCINRCASYNDANRTEIAAGSSGVCNAVCWRHSLTSDWPGQCFGVSTQNSSSGGFSIDTSATECDAAGWINQEIL